MENNIDYNSTVLSGQSSTPGPTGGLIYSIGNIVSNMVGSLSILGVGSRSRIKETNAQYTFLLEQQEEKAHNIKVILLLLVVTMIVFFAIRSVK